MVDFFKRAVKLVYMLLKMTNAKMVNGKGGDLHLCISFLTSL